METSNQVPRLRCRKCRKCVLDVACLLLENAVDEVTSECRIWHVDCEQLPDWILTSIYQASWTVGKLNCQHCGARLGGFNFINHAKCPCGLDLTVHLCKSRLDHDQGPSLAIPRSVNDCRSGWGQKQGRELCLDPVAGSPAVSTVFAECGQMTKALCLEAQPPRMESRTANVGDPANPLVSVEIKHRKASSLDHSSGSEAGACGGFSDVLQTCPPDDTLQSGPGHGQGSPLLAYPCASWQQKTDTAQTDLEPIQLDLRLPAEHQLEPGSWPQQLQVATMQELGILRRRHPSQTSTEEAEDLQEEREGQGTPVESLSLAGSSGGPTMELRLNKRERNRLKSQRRKQRRRERWIQSQLQEHTQSLPGNVTNSEDEDIPEGDREGFTCAVCLDVYYSPHMCHPCHHVFCEPCLRTLAKNRPASTPCPLCRTLITHVVFQKELNHTAKTFFPKLYVMRKQNFQQARCSRWPLPSCRKLFHFFGGFRRRAPAGRRQFPHGGYRLDTLDMEDEWQGWRLDMDVVIIYIYSVNWVLGFVVCCFLCYVFLSSL